MKQLLFSLLLTIGVLVSLQGQIYNQLVSTNTGVHSNYEELGSIVENPNTEELISASSVRQSSTSNLDDVMLQVFDPTGAVVSSIRVGNSNLSELVTGVALCDDEQSVIVVGESFSFGTPQTSRAFAMRVELATGLVFWHRHFDAATFSTTNQDRFNGVTRIRNSGAEEYFVYGNSSGVNNNNRDKMFIVRLDLNGNMVNFVRLSDVPNIPSLNQGSQYFPSDIALNAVGNYVITGTVETSIGFQTEVDVFLMEIGQSGGPANGPFLQTFDITDGIGVRRMNLAPRLVCDNQQGLYFLAFTTPFLFSNGNTGGVYLTGLLLEQGTYNVIWSKAYWDPNYHTNMVTGVGMDPNTSDFLIGTIHNTAPGPNIDYTLGMLRVGLNGSAADFVQYDPISNQSYGYYCMKVGDRGVYHKAQLTSTNSERIIRTEFNGNGNAYPCFQQNPSDDSGLTVTRSKTQLHSSSEPGSRIVRWRRYPLSGSVDRCDGTIFSYRKASETPTLVQAAKLYPSFISSASFAKIDFEAKESETYLLEVYNLSGQLLYAREYLADKGNQSIKLEASVVQKGINLVRLTNGTGETVLSSRLVKD